MYNALQQVENFHRIRPNPKLKMNKPKRGRAPIKKLTNKKFNTLKKKDLESKRGKKKHQTKE